MRKLDYLINPLKIHLGFLLKVTCMFLLVSTLLINLLKIILLSLKLYTS